MLTLTRRNITIFLRDRVSVFFTFLSAIIILGLYILFLGELMKKSWPDLVEVGQLVDSWVMAGILAVTAMTAPLGAISIMVEDTVSQRTKDFGSSPLKKSELVGGYMLSTVVIGLLLSLFTLVLVQLYLIVTGGAFIGLLALAKLLGVMMLSVLTGSSIVLLLTSFVRSQAAFSTMGTIVGTLIGFLMGIYIPIGSLPEAVQLLIRLFPMSHAAALTRQIMIEKPLDVSLAAAPAQAITEFKQTMGVQYVFGSYTTSAWFSIGVLLVTAIVCYGLAIWRMSKR